MPQASRRRRSFAHRETAAAAPLASHWQAQARLGPPAPTSQIRLGRRQSNWPGRPGAWPGQARRGDPPGRLGPFRHLIYRNLNLKFGLASAFRVQLQLERPIEISKTRLALRLSRQRVRARSEHSKAGCCPALKIQENRLGLRLAPTIEPIGLGSQARSCTDSQGHATVMVTNRDLTPSLRRLSDGLRIGPGPGDSEISDSEPELIMSPMASWF